MRRYLQVDVFSDQPLKGNGLAVVVDGVGLSDQVMQDFAIWTQQSETTFLLPPRGGADYRVRIFSATGEMRFAGHPTLGSCAAWLHAGGVPAVEGRDGYGPSICGSGDSSIPNGNRCSHRDLCRIRCSR